MIDVLERPTIQEQTDVASSKVVKPKARIVTPDMLLGEAIAKIISEERGFNTRRKGKSVEGPTQFVVNKGMQSGLSYRAARYSMAQVIEQACKRNNQVKLNEAIQSVVRPAAINHRTHKNNMKGGE